jgi:hypothetical protein
VRCRHTVFEDLLDRDPFRRSPISKVGVYVEPFSEDIRLWSNKSRTIESENGTRREPQLGAPA